MKPLAAYMDDPWNPRNSLPMCRWLTQTRDESDRARMTMMGNQIVPPAASLAYDILIRMHREMCQGGFHF